MNFIYTIINYWKYIIASVIIAVASYLVSHNNKKHYERGRIDGIVSMQQRVDYLKTTLSAIERESLEASIQHAEQMTRISRSYEILKAEYEQKERTQYARVQKIVEKPIYHNTCFDDDGLSELNAAIQGKHDTR